ncbi:FUSC family protein [Solimonas soli]|uniref:FUSC family protein n=1 Tax=Solimonas soli TaxID=413479 RepID=UPI0004B628C4|nr:FUSC family protein [Solimonas soli]
MVLNIPRSALLFSAKNFLAGMLALYIALRAGLGSPAWSVVTAYIVAQPHAGASLSKATYRVCGTFVGACASIFLVPPLVQTPAMLILAVAAWLGFCVFASIVDRTARGYLFALAGYTSCIIIFPILAHPQDVFSYGLSRFEEISIGIVCSAVVHTVVLPASTMPVLRQRLQRALADARAACADALLSDAEARVGADRQRLAVAINELHELLLHLRFEAPHRSSQARAVRATLARIERVMPLSMAVADRVAELRRFPPLPSALREWLTQAQQWFASNEAAQPLAATAGDLLRRREALRPPLDAPLDWPSALADNLLERTAELIRQQVSILRLQGVANASIAAAGSDDSAGDGGEAETSPPREIDRDLRGAAGAGLATALTLLLGNALWVASGWPDGYGAVMMAGVYFAVYSGTSDPSQMLKNKLVGVALRLLIGAVYVVAILPAISGFDELVLALAPSLLVIGVLMALPRYSAMSFNFVVGIFSPSIVDRSFHTDFQAYLNAGVATLLGIYFAMLMVSVTRFLWLDGVVRRTLDAGRADISSLRYVREASQAAWRSRMAHRIALLTPRLAAIPSEAAARPDAALRDMMTGSALAELHAAAARAPEPVGGALRHLVEQVAAHFGELRRAPGLAPPLNLRAAIDERLAQAASAPTVDAKSVLALTSLRRNLFADDHSVPAGMAPAT